ncbi:hypothetical protein M413DRAFT_447431 [Hebeloma cylindrosporum]|uniref:Uncharacterized protein n=1 Tax=Hebeloma cylindrosporum TaxID=76867 RepID=A0A0C3C640_HEBCY|nr:hypothetical protein M413DRAFT_447431 [Hebeloma cylindrosporum h7]
MQGTRQLRGKAVAVQWFSNSLISVLRMITFNILACLEWIKKVLSFRIRGIEMSISTLEDSLSNRFHCRESMIVQSQ